MGSRNSWIAAAAAALLFTLQLSAQTAPNPMQVALKRWYQANLAAQVLTTCGGFAYSLAFDGAHMWMACFSDNEILELNASDGALVRTVTGLTGPWDVLFDGANIWVTGNNELFKIRASTGALLGTFSVEGMGMTFDGQYVWVAGGPPASTRCWQRRVPSRRIRLPAGVQSPTAWLSTAPTSGQVATAIRVPSFS